jgi:PAS domain S-box-containing protein
MTESEHGTAADPLDRLPCGILSFDDDGRVVRINATLLEMLGLEREDVVGRHLEGLLTVGSRIFYQTHLFPLVRMMGRAEEIFLTLRPASGEDVGALVNVTRREESGGTLYDAVLMRVQERRKYEEELVRARRAAEEARAELERQAEELETMAEELLDANEELRVQSEHANQLREDAEAASRAKSDFLALMSHELRTPLNAIGGYTQLLALGVPGPVNDKQREMLERVSRNQAFLLGLINQLLDLSKLEAGGVGYAIEEFGVRAVVDSVVPMIEPQMAEKGLTLTTRVATDLRVRADQDKLRQILVNLLSNAIKFTAEGGRIVLECDWNDGAAGQSQVALSVSDTGIGIPPEMHQAVFEPFVQVEAPAGRTRSAGTGLGLSISRQFARGMGGDITLTSQPGQGSTFTLVLPASVPAGAGRS